MSIQFPAVRRAIAVAVAAATLSALPMAAAQTAPAAASPVKAKQLRLRMVIAGYASSVRSVADVLAAVRSNRPIKRQVINAKISSAQLQQLVALTAANNRHYPALHRLFSNNPLLAKPRLRPTVRASILPAIGAAAIGWEVYAAWGTAGAGALIFYSQRDKIKEALKEACDHFADLVEGVSTDEEKESALDEIEIWEGLLDGEDNDFDGDDSGGWGADQKGPPS